MNGMVVFAGVIFLLWLGRAIFIPVVIAIFLWYLINAIATYYRKVMPYQPSPARKDFKFLSSALDLLSYVLSLATFVGVVYFFITQIRPMFGALMSRLPEIQTKLVMLSDYIAGHFGVSLGADSIPNIAKIAANIGSSAIGFASTMAIVFVYMFFMFIEQSTFNKKFASLMPNKNRSKKMRYIIRSIDENMKKYLFMKTFISAITGLVSYLWLYSIGLEFAGVWAFIVFITSYIPTIGAITACSLPILYALITGDTINLAILTGVGLIFLQILFGNLIEPKLTGKTLNLSTLAILINLVLWGTLWGVAGMFFSVPLLVATFVITAQFDSTRWIAVLLSTDGEIPGIRDED